MLSRDSSLGHDVTEADDVTELYYDVRLPCNDPCQLL